MPSSNSAIGFSICISLASISLFSSLVDSVTAVDVPLFWFTVPVDELLEELLDVLVEVLVDVSFELLFDVFYDALLDVLLDVFCDELLDVLLDVFFDELLDEPLEVLWLDAYGHTPLGCKCAGYPPQW